MFKVGDRVRFGKAEGVVIYIWNDSYIPIRVEFGGGLQIDFTEEGYPFLITPNGFPQLELIQDETVALKNDCFKTDVGNE